jgi:hypothetical protein
MSRVLVGFEQHSTRADVCPISLVLGIFLRVGVLCHQEPLRLAGQVDYQRKRAR